MTAHSVGKQFDLAMPLSPTDLVRAGQEPQAGLRAGFPAVAVWLERGPAFPDGRAPPHFTPPSPSDPDNGTVDARRRGQFPIGVAVETALPESWGKDAKDKTVRVAAIGQGEVFVGADLKPPQERLLLQTVNWLLGRDDYLPQAEHPWSYPRLALTPEEPRRIGCGCGGPPGAAGAVRVCGIRGAAVPQAAVNPAPRVPKTPPGATLIHP